MAAGASAKDAPGWLNADAVWTGGWYGILQAGGLLFFAFAGYARIATMGEEVRDPAKTIPRAIVLAFAGALVVYAAVGIAVLSALGPTGTAASAEPVAAAAAASGWTWAVPVVRVGAAAASLGALLALIAGVGRTTFAMAREGDLPPFLAAVHPRWRVPHRAEVAVGLLVITLVAASSTSAAPSASRRSACCCTTWSPTSPRSAGPRARRYPRALQVLGAAGCAVLCRHAPVAERRRRLAVVASRDRLPRGAAAHHASGLTSSASRVAPARRSRTRCSRRPPPGRAEP